VLEARRHAAALTKPELIVAAFRTVAESRRERDPAEARECLAEAERCLTRSPELAEKARAYLRLAAAFGSLDPAYARQLTTTALLHMGRTKAELDSLRGVSIKLDTFREKRGVILEPADLTTTLGKLVQVLVAEDFEGTLLTISQVGSGEAKLMAELVLAREGFLWVKRTKARMEAERPMRD